MTIKNEKIAVLLGGHSQERKISLISGSNILKSLIQSGICAHPVDTRDFPIMQLPYQKFTKAFIALHGKAGEDGTIQSVLKYLNIPFTGSKTLSSAISINKLKTKLLWKSIDLPVIPHFYITKCKFNKNILPSLKKNLIPLGLPIIIKPNTEGSSIGITIVYSYETLYKACKIAFKFDNTILFEKFVYGEEYTISILDKKILPIIRICPENTFYNYNAKYLSNRTTYFCPSGLSRKKETELKNIVKSAWNIINGSGWGRIDVIMDYKKNFWLLEANTCPGMTYQSLFPMAAQEANISYPLLVKKILDLAH